MNTQTIQRLSAEAMNDLREIVKKEIKEPMTDEEIEEMGIGLLRLFSIVMDRPPVPFRVPLTEPEQKALDYINIERKEGREPTVRGIAMAARFRSSRSGKNMLDRSQPSHKPKNLTKTIQIPSNLLRGTKNAI